MSRRNKTVGKFTSFILLSVIFTIISLGLLVTQPKVVRIVEGENRNLDVRFPYKIAKSSENLFKLQSNNDPNLVTVKVFGLLPARNIDFRPVERKNLIPGGNAIGVKMSTKGVLVVAISDVTILNGEKLTPAKDAGIRAGDSILKVNDIEIESSEHLVGLLNNLGNQEIQLVLERNNIEFKTSIKPVKSFQDNSYRLGIWVRDKTAGIGTLTFIDEDNNFGALGHGISDSDTSNLMKLDNGNIVKAKIQSVEIGKTGAPGEMKGVFNNSSLSLGDIKLNTPYGLYGIIGDKSFVKDKNSIPIGFKEEVNIGKASILATVEDDRIEEFDIEILKTEDQHRVDQKSMVIKIVDERLLNKTGGIVQGMSGSPIIQDGKLIGAVTHVLINDPTKGYGIYIEWMLEQLK